MYVCQSAKFRRPVRTPGGGGRGGQSLTRSRSVSQGIGIQLRYQPRSEPSARKKFTFRVSKATLEARRLSDAPMVK